MKNANSHPMSETGHTSKLVALAFLAAIIVVLQMIGGMIHVGPVSFSLVLVPIVVGSTLYGPGAGAFLGAAFGAVTVIGCMTGTDPGGFVLWSANPWLTALVCFVKAILAGVCSGLVYRLASLQHPYLSVLLAALIAPIVNTLTFCLAMVFLFRDTLNAWAGGSDILQYLLITIVGVNFLVELGLNAVLCPAIYRIVTVIRKK